MPRMIVDVHTHVFPPACIADRERLVADDPGFAALYADPRARMASADELLAAMDAAGVDRAVAAGFAWRSPERCEAHASHLLEAAAASGGRLLPFLPVPTAFLLDSDRAPSEARDWLAPLLAQGAAPAAGLGEIRLGGGPAAPPLEQQAEAAARLAALVAGHDLPLLVHASEEVGHAYPGKAGGFTPGGLSRLLAAHPVRVIAAHWGAGLPFSALMPEVRSLLDEGRLVFDSAASSLLYDPAVFDRVAALAGPEHVLWGSDFPLRDMATDRAAAEAALPDPQLRAAVLGGNAARFLGLA